MRTGRCHGASVVMRVCGSRGGEVSALHERPKGCERRDVNEDARVRVSFAVVGRREVVEGIAWASCGETLGRCLLSDSSHLGSISYLFLKADHPTT